MTSWTCPPLLWPLFSKLQNKQWHDNLLGNFYPYLPSGPIQSSLVCWKTREIRGIPWWYRQAWELQRPCFFSTSSPSALFRHQFPAFRQRKQSRKGKELIEISLQLPCSFYWGVRSRVCPKDHKTPKWKKKKMLKSKLRPSLSALYMCVSRVSRVTVACCEVFSLCRSVGFSYPKSDFESFKMEAHEVAPDVVDVLPAKAIEVRATFI